jgi:hypothetical protein
MAPKTPPKKGSSTPTTRPSGVLSVPGVSPSNPSGGGQYFGGGGESNPFAPAPAPGSSFDWNSGLAPLASQVNSLDVPIYGASGDTFGLGKVFPMGASVGGGLMTPQVQSAPKDIEYYTASVAKLSVSNQQILGTMLADAGIIGSTTKGYKTSSIQSGIRTALEQSSEAHAPSLTDFLGSAIQQRQAAGLGATGTTQASPARIAGDEAAVVPKLQVIADAYQIPMSTQALQQFAASYVSQGLTSTSGLPDTTDAEGEFTQYAQGVAATLYPTLAPQILKGVQTKTLLDPYGKLAASQLGVDQATIDWANPQWSKALSGAVDPATGRAVPMGMDQWGQTMRADPTYGWQNTDAAHSAAASFASSILKTFGAVGSDTISTSATPGSGA